MNDVVSLFDDAMLSRCWLRRTGPYKCSHSHPLELAQAPRRGFLLALYFLDASVELMEHNLFPPTQLLLIIIRDVSRVVILRDGCKALLYLHRWGGLRMHQRTSLEGKRILAASWTAGRLHEPLAETHIVKMVPAVELSAPQRVRQALQADDTVP